MIAAIHIHTHTNICHSLNEFFMTKRNCSQKVIIYTYFLEKWQKALLNICSEINGSKFSWEKYKKSVEESCILLVLLGEIGIGRHRYCFKTWQRSDCIYNWASIPWKQGLNPYFMSLTVLVDGV